MGQYAFIPVVMVLMVTAVVYNVWIRNKIAREHPVDWAKFVFGTIARNFGLGVAQGDPEANVLKVFGEFQQTSHGGGILNTTKEMELRAEGMPDGRATELRVYVHSKKSDALVVVETTVTTDIRLSMRVDATFQPFEIRVKKPRYDFMVPRKRLALPGALFGDPATDAAMILDAADSSMGPLLAPALSGLLDDGYLHIHGEHGEIHATAIGESMGMALLGRIYETRDAMLRICAALEGAR